MAWLISMHGRLFTTIMLVFGVLTVWGVLAALGRRGPSDYFMSVLAIGQLLMIAQGLIGTIVWLGGLHASDHVTHVIYGILCVLALPAIFIYVRERNPVSQQWTYSLTCLFLFSIAYRALETGRGFGFGS